MANSAGLCTSFKVELMLGAHQFGSVTLISRTSLTAPTTDTFKMALYQTTATIGPSTSVYTSTGEVSSAGYTAGGAAVTNATAPTSSGTTAYWTPSASVSWTGVTFTTDCALLYNSTQTVGGFGRAVGSYTFSSQTVTAGNFTLTMPTNAAGTALIQIA
jgi:hypothetical protein